MNACKAGRRWFQFRLRTLLIVVVVLGMASAYIAHEANSVHARPSWFAIGPEVYHEDEVAEAEKQVLSLRLEPHWFVGCDKFISKAEFDAHFARPDVLVQQEADGRYLVPDRPPYPQQVAGLPLEDHGVSRVGVWSLARYGDPDESEQAYQRCLMRICKVATHEIGHMFGIEHCTAYECGMNGSNNLEETDRGPLAFCPECSAKIWWACGARPEKWYAGVAEFAEQHDFKDEAALRRKCERAVAK